jgi:hypothetical protein
LNYITIISRLFFHDSENKNMISYLYPQTGLKSGWNDTLNGLSP